MRAFTTTLLTLFALHGTAQAQCLRGSTTVLWSYPAQGDTDVPLDVSVQIVTSNPITETWRATIDDRPVRLDANGAYPLDGLESDSHHVFKLEEGRAPAGVTGSPLTFELSFDTGSSEADQASPPAVGTSELTTLRELNDPVCSAVQGAGRCLDTIYAMRAIHMEPGDAIAWQASLPGRSAKLWPSECAAVFGVIDETMEGCYELRAVSANGELSDQTTYCPRQPKKSGACGVAGPAAASGTATLAASALLLGLGMYRRRRARH